MQFIRNTLIIGKNSDFQSELKIDLNALSKKVNVEIISDKNLLSTKLAEKTINSVFINLENEADCRYIFRLLGMYKMKTNEKLTVFFTSENFETFQKIINDTVLDGIDILPWPVDSDELAHKMIDSIFDKRLSKQVVTEKKNTLNVDLEFIQVFIQATRKTLEEMGQVQDLKHGKPTFKDKMTDPIEKGIASKIMISSDFFTGNFYVIFPETSFLNIYENAVMERCEGIDEENKDFAGELANIIYGQAKKVLSASGLNLDMAIPSVHHSSNVEAELVIVIPFTSSIGNFYIAVAPGKI